MGFWGFGLAFALIAPLLGAQSVRPYQPAIDVLDYDLSLDLPDTGAVIRGTATLTVRLNHRREGWRSFTFTLPTASAAAAATAPVTTQPTVDVTGVGAVRRTP